jgi:hypothetical protein
MPHQHKTITLQWHGQPLDIDEQLAQLMPLLWERDIETNRCCQERYPGLAWIEFHSTDDVMEFLEVAQREYKVEVETWDEGEDGRLAIMVSLVVLFPTADIPRLVEAFEQAEQPDTR